MYNLRLAASFVCPACKELFKNRTLASALRLFNCHVGFINLLQMSHLCLYSHQLYRTPVLYFYRHLINTLNSIYFV